MLLQTTILASRWPRVSKTFATLSSSSSCRFVCGAHLRGSDPDQNQWRKETTGTFLCVCLSASCSLWPGEWVKVQDFKRCTLLRRGRMASHGSSRLMANNNPAHG
jgi:hypothetical protein